MEYYYSCIRFLLNVKSFFDCYSVLYLFTEGFQSLKISLQRILNRNKYIILTITIYVCQHTCQLSRIIRESPRYRTNLLASHMRMDGQPNLPDKSDFEPLYHCNLTSCLQMYSNQNNWFFASPFLETQNNMLKETKQTLSWFVNQLDRKFQECFLYLIFVQENA